MFLRDSLPYNPKDADDIKRYAEDLLKKTLRDVIDKKELERLLNTDNPRNKGGFGNLVESTYFYLKNNSRSEPDFPEVGVELKTSPLKIKKKSNKYGSKERLVLNTINFETEYLNTFENSAFWQKNKLLLLIFYLHEKDKIKLDYIFKQVELWKFPDKDLRIIKDDWSKIISKIKEGKAHELSEGDTLYLAACTKGKNKTSLRKQPGTDVLAMQRGFALKSSYLNSIIDKKLQKELEPIIKEKNLYSEQETFEEHIINRFKPYYDKTEDEILKVLKMEKSKAKQRLYILSKGILGIKGNKIEEFEKADVMMKTIRLRKRGSPQEDMSFAQVQYKKIVNESWQKSYWYKTLSKRFFFVVFQIGKDNQLRLKKVLFWTMPINDLEIVKEVWEDTKLKIINNNYINFVQISDDRISHIRPKALVKVDYMETPQGGKAEKKCYWLNKSYIKEMIK